MAMPMSIEEFSSAPGVAWFKVSITTTPAAIFASLIAAARESISANLLKSSLFRMTLKLLGDRLFFSCHALMRLLIPLLPSSPMYVTDKQQPLVGQALQRFFQSH